MSGLSASSVARPFVAASAHQPSQIANHPQKEFFDLSRGPAEIRKLET
jgi:hypothetical protein